MISVFGILRVLKILRVLGILRVLRILIVLRLFENVFYCYFIQIRQNFLKMFSTRLQLLLIKCDKQIAVTRIWQSKIKNPHKIPI